MINPVTWFHKILSFIWILSFSLLAFGLAGTQTGSVRYTNGQIGIMQKKFGEGVKWLTKKTFQAIFQPVKARALFGIGDVVIDLAQVLANVLAALAKQVLNALVSAIMDTFSSLTRSLLRGLSDSLSVFSKLKNLSDVTNRLYSDIVSRANTWLAGLTKKIFGIVQERPVTDASFTSRNSNNPNDYIVSSTNSIVVAGTALKVAQNNVPIYIGNEEESNLNLDIDQIVNRLCKTALTGNKRQLGGLIPFNNYFFNDFNLPDINTCVSNFSEQIAHNSQAVIRELGNTNGQVTAVAENTNEDQNEENPLIEQMLPHNPAYPKTPRIIRVGDITTSNAFDYANAILQSAKPTDPGNNVNWKSIFSEIFKALVKDIGDFITKTLLGVIRYLFGSISKFLSNLNLPSWLKSITVNPILGTLNEMESRLTEFINNAQDNFEKSLDKDIPFEEKYCKFYWNDEFNSGEVARMINAGIEEECQKRGLNFGFPEEETRNKYNFDRSSCRIYLSPTQDAEWNQNLKRYGDGNINIWNWNCEKRGLELPRQVRDPNNPTNQVAPNANLQVNLGFA